MMETELSRVRSSSSPSTIKQELDTEAQHSMHQLEGIEFESTIKAENYTDIDGYPVENIVKSELVEFQSNPCFSQHDMMIAVTLEKIPKTETKILDDEASPSYDIENNDNDPYNNVNSSDVDTDSDPELDPFADVDCDPCFSRKLPPQSYIPISSATQVESIKSTASVDANANASSNPPSSAKAVTVNKHRELTRFGKNLQCQLCDEPQHSKSKLGTHLKLCEVSHKNRRRFCELCNILFSVPQSYRKHALQMHGIKDAKNSLFNCQFCPRSFRREESLIVHAATHRHPESRPAYDGDLKPRPFKCQECPATFSTSSALGTHMTSKKNERKFKCSMPNCDKAYNFSNYLKCHIQSAHSEEKPFNCQAPNCCKSFKLSSQLNKHRFCHSEETPFTCPRPDCDRAFKSKEAVTKHLQIHAGTRRYRHVTDRPFKCGLCSSAFCKKWQLAVHLKLVHPKDDEILKCPESNCETTFKYKHNLRLHLAAFHTGKQMAFPCPEPNCSKSFKTEKGVQEHLRNHTRPYKCTEPGCAANFPRASYLNSHIKSKHKQ